MVSVCVYHRIVNTIRSLHSCRQKVLKKKKLFCRQNIRRRLLKLPMCNGYIFSQLFLIHKNNDTETDSHAFSIHYYFMIVCSFEKILKESIHTSYQYQYRQNSFTHKKNQIFILLLTQTKSVTNTIISFQIISFLSFR